MSGLRELAGGLWRWTAWHPEWHPAGFGDEVASFVLRDDAGTILVDPLLGEDADVVTAALDRIVEGRVRILVTIPYHVRSAEPLWRRYRDDHETTIHGHELCAKRLEDEAGFRPVAAGDEIAGGIRAHPIGNPRRSELPFELPSHRALAFGDAVVEADGALHVWDQPIESERRRQWWEERYLPTLRRLAGLPVERVLVTHGEPVLRDGAKALAAALERPPWQVRSSG